MQTEDKQPDTNPEDRGERVQRHWHMQTIMNSELVANRAIDAAPGESAHQLHSILHQSLHLSVEDLDFLAADRAGEPERVGLAYLRMNHLAHLCRVFDPQLYQHPLFEDAAQRECLEEAIEMAFDDLGVVLVAEDAAMKFYFCDDPQCPQLVDLANAPTGLEDLFREQGIRVQDPAANDFRDAQTEAYINADRSQAGDLFNHADSVED